MFLTTFKELVQCIGILVCLNAIVPFCRCSNKFHEITDYGDHHILCKKITKRNVFHKPPFMPN